MRNGGFRLVMNQGAQPGQTFVLSQDLIILGRDPSSSIVIDAMEVSRQHARLTRYGGQIVIEDLRSANGTFVNGLQLTEPRPLANGDVISLGGVVTFTFYHPSIPAPYQPPPQPQYTPPPVTASPQRKRRRLPCLVVLLISVCLGGSLVAVGGWFYGDQIVARIQNWWVESDGKIDPIVGGTVVADDGASVTFPPFFGASRITATFTQVTAQSGQVVDDAMAASGEYLLSLSDPNAVSGDVIVSLPLASESMPADWDPVGVLPEFYNEQTGAWEPVGQVVGYDEETGQVSFDVPFGAAAPSASISRRVPGTMLLTPPYQKAETRYRIRLHFLSNWVTLVSDQSDFEIEYYPISGLSYSLQKDDEWNSASGLATDPKVPDFAEDLDHALNQGYQGLLEIQHNTGQLFKSLSTPQEIVVTNIGAVEGQTSLFWGTVKISARRINSWPQMQQVATHELVHLLSDQYYNSVSAARNRWFFEATAEYFAARARGLSEAARGQHYADPSINNDVYLSIPINAANVSSYYPAAHFLDWCSQQYGQAVVPDAIVYGSYHPLDRNDMTHFSQSLELHGEPGGVGAAYTAYIRDLVSKPEDYGGANSTFKSNITAYTAQHNLSATQFDDYITYVKLSRCLRPLSTAGAFLWARNSDDALLVIDSASSHGGLAQATTYDFVSTLSSDYTDAAPVDQGLTFPYPSEGIITVPHFGRLEAKKQVEQLIANGSTTEDAQIEVIYYLLRPPAVTEVSNGVVRWSIGKLGNMPRELIHGYHVYKNGTQLTGKPVPAPAEGWDNLRFESEQIQEGNAILVQVVDRKGNAWPQVTSNPPPPTPTPTQTPTPTPDTPTPTTLTPTPDITPPIMVTTTPGTPVTPSTSEYVEIPGEILASFDFNMPDCWCRDRGTTNWKRCDAEGPAQLPQDRLCDEIGCSSDFYFVVPDPGDFMIRVHWDKPDPNCAWCFSPGRPPMSRVTLEYLDDAGEWQRYIDTLHRIVGTVGDDPIDPEKYWSADTPIDQCPSFLCDARDYPYCPSFCFAPGQYRIRVWRVDESIEMHSNDYKCPAQGSIIVCYAESPAPPTPASP
jgi:hypothetical protein